MENSLPLTITDKAFLEAKNIMRNKNIPEGYGLRIGIRGAGCAGTSYLLGFDKEKMNDLTYEIEGIPIYIEKKHLMYIIGMTLDFVETNDAKGFSFLKPEEKAKVS